MKNYLLFFFISISVGFASCKKGNDNQPQVYGDSLSGDDLLFFDTIGVYNWTADSILGNSTGHKSTVSSPSQSLYTALLNNARSLSDLKNTAYHADEGEYKPAHWGIAYSFGQRDYSQRLFPKGGSPLHKSYAIFGTDCSGLMINLFKQQGIDLGDCYTGNFETALQSALTKNATVKNISVDNRGCLPLDQIADGDIIIWLTKGHMGIVSVSPSGVKVFFQSNGTKNPTNVTDQQKDWGLTRGVHPIDLLKAINGKDYWGTGYEILRLTDAPTGNAVVPQYHLFGYNEGGSGIDSSWVDGNYLGRGGSINILAVVEGENVYDPKTNSPFFAGIPIYFSCHPGTSPGSGSFDNAMVQTSSNGDGATSIYHWVTNPGIIVLTATMPDGTQLTKTMSF